MERERMERKIRFGLIGSGMIASFHAQALHAIRQAEIAGVYDASEVAAERFCEKWGGKVYASIDALLADASIDVVCVLTPNGLHAQMTLQALEAGKHVVVEKPMAITLEEAERVIALSNSTGKMVCVISQLRFSPAVQAVHCAVQEGKLGRITSASLAMKYWRNEAYYTSSWRGTWKMDGGGALMNQGIHGVDLLQYLVGSVVRVSAFCKTQIHQIETEDSAVAALEFACGAVGTLEGSTACYPGYPRRIEICGEKGSIVLEEDDIIRWDIPEERPKAEPRVSAASSDPSAIQADGHERQLTNMIRAILGEEPLLVDAKEGKKPVEIILGIYESSRTGRPVEIRKGE